MAVANRKKDPAAVALGRKGGKKGGPARAAKLTPDSEVSARKAVQARWARAKKADNDIVAGESRMNTSDRAVLDILSRIKTTKDHSEVRDLSDQLEHVLFHKQYSHS